MRTIQDEVRRSLTKYALLPVLFLALVGFALVGASWQHYVAGLSEERRAVAAEVIETEIADYEARAAYVAELGLHPADLRASRKARADLYAYLYHEVNITHDGTAFFLLDGNQTVLSNTDGLPPYLLPIGSSWGILRRLSRNPHHPGAEFVLRPDDLQDLAIGQAIVSEAGAVEGYILFVIPAEHLRRNISSPHLDFVLEDSFGNVCLQTGGDYADRLHKLAPEFHGSRHRLVQRHQDYYYVTAQPLVKGDFRLYTVMPVTDLLQRYALGILIVLAVLVLFIPILLVSIRRESRARVQAIAVEEERAMAMSEVRRLESQFNPHFLFNTLENIKFMVRLDSEAAQRMLMDLSKLLRYSIKGRERLVDLAEDLAYTHSYIEIQKYRFGKRLAYEEEIPEEVLDCRVPRLIVQPVIENAIRYGASADGAIRVQVRAAREADLLVLQVQDCGPGLPPERLRELRQMLAEGADPSVHTGIYNIHRRLQLMYGDGYGLTLECPAEGGTLVRLTLPWEKGEYDAESRDRRG